MKFDRAGKKAWAARYDGGLLPNDAGGNAITLDIGGNVIVAGDSYYENRQVDSVVLSHDIVSR